MANQGADFEALARQYWSAWGEALRAGPAPASPPGTSPPGIGDAMDWWSQLARGAGLPGTANDTVDRFNTQARDWFGRMQQVAAQFAGQNASAGDIAGAWKQAIGGIGGNPFAHLFAGMQGPGQQGAEQWFRQAMPAFQSMFGGASNPFASPFAGAMPGASTADLRSWLHLPTFGFAREHQERWQQLAQAQLDLHEQTQAHNALLGEAGQRAFELFEKKLAERSEPGKQLASARALFDLWIDAAEDAYAELALSPRYRDAYGALVNAQMRLRAAMQREVEQASGQFGMPTRTELDAAHRKIVQLERELRRLRDAVQATAAGDAPARAANRAADAPAARPSRKAAAKKTAASKRTTR